MMSLQEHVSDLSSLSLFSFFGHCANSGCASNTKLKLGGAMSCLPLPVFLFLVMQPSPSGRCKQYKALGGAMLRVHFLGLIQ